MNFKDFIIYWNQIFPIDYWYRKKYGIRFNSEEHRRTNILDVYLEFIENNFFEEVKEDMKRPTEMKKRYSEHGLLLPRENEFDEDDLFEGQIDYSEFDD